MYDSPPYGRLHIYRLIDPRNQLPFYVGCTGGSLKNRYLGHKASSNNPQFQVNFRFKEIRDAGFDPIIEYIQEGVRLDVCGSREERFWILKYKEMGYPMCNGTIPRLVEQASPVETLKLLRVSTKRPVILAPEPVIFYPPMPDISDRFAMLRWHQEKRAIDQDVRFGNYHTETGTVRWWPGRTLEAS